MSLRRAVIASSLLLAFCNETSSKSGPSGASSATPAAPAVALSPADEAKDLFKNRCAMCHGPTGAGDGPTAATLNPKPRDFHDKEWQKSISDTRMHDVIVGGGVAIGKSPLMPPNPDLAKKPAVVDQLVAIVRGYGS